MGMGLCGGWNRMGMEVGSAWIWDCGGSGLLHGFETVEVGKGLHHWR
jgi:hypothetical protein